MAAEKEESGISRGVFKFLFTIIGYFLVLKIGKQSSSEVFASILLFTFPILYDMSVIPKGAKNIVKTMYRASIFLLLVYSVVSVLGLMNILTITKGVLLFDENVTLSRYWNGCPAEWLLHFMVIFVLFALMDWLAKD